MDFEMIALLFLSSILQSGSLTSQWFPHPTGKNAFEDFTRAADVIATREYATLSAWQPDDGEGIEFPTVGVGLHIDIFKPPTQDEITNIRAQLTANDFLSVCSIEASKFGGALEFIRSGNSKHIEFNGSTYDQEKYVASMLPYFNAIANLALSVAYARFAEGRVDLGIQIMIDQFDFADSLARTGLTGTLCSLDIEEKDLIFAGNKLSQCSEKECRQLYGAIERILDRSPAIAEMFTSSEKFWEGRIEEFVQRESPKTASISDDGGILPKGELDDISLSRQIQKLSSDDRDALISNASTLAQTAITQLAKRFYEPEKNWLSPLPENQLFKTGGVTNADQLPVQVAYRNRPKSGIIRSSLMRSSLQRIRLRLVGLNAAILLFKWRNGRLPQALSELKSIRTVDPLTGKSFEYVINNDGTYEVFSLGTPQTGPVRLPRKATAGNARVPIHP